MNNEVESEKQIFTQAPGFSEYLVQYHAETFHFSFHLIAIPWNRKIIDCKVTLQKLSGVQESTLLWPLFYSTSFCHIKMFFKP